MTLTEFEQEREARIAANKLRMQELGLEEAAEALQQLGPGQKPKQARKKREKPPVDALEVRRSGRERKEVNYADLEKVPRGDGSARPAVDYTERIKACTLTEEEAERLRIEAEAKKSNKSGKSRGPVDSGKGVRVQGGRVYDSKHGVTCHWCRQKTLEDHVTCTNSNCGNGRRMPLSFCAKCLRNRHGEDFEAAEASGGWWCPSCRGSCGPGCVICCNCGPCRKRAGLEPTHQVVKLARDAGFGNVHDYLVHLVTGEDAEQVAARKLTHSWGSWLKQDGSDASEQTGGHAAAGCEEGCEHEHDEQEEQEQAASKDCAKAGCDCAAPRAKKQAAKRQGTAASRKRKAAAAPAAAEDEEPAAAEHQLLQQDEDASQYVDASDAPLLSSQDSRLSRKQRIMQQMGLAAVTVAAK